MRKPFAIVPGASSGIGLELAAICAQEDFDLLVAADRPEIQAALTASAFPAPMSPWPSRDLHRKPTNRPQRDGAIPTPVCVR
jgi:NAD(P)-dependent dehydrogenase (short-subunit alcohol dehydrogenase family)